MAKVACQHLSDEDVRVGTYAILVVDGMEPGSGVTALKVSH